MIGLQPTIAKITPKCLNVKLTDHSATLTFFLLVSDIKNYEKQKEPEGVQILLPGMQNQILKKHCPMWICIIFED